ncbi:MAG: hypothetical protein LUC88_10995 [Prevotella sp.]|nr:hypothetical protein [Prevotella sp.]
MKTKIVYVVVSSEKDIFLEQAFISSFSVKKYMTDAKILFVVDQQTYSTLKGVRKEETKYADEIIPVKIDGDYNARQRSRILKSSVRKYVKGDFLFIDTDTIVVKPLYEIDKINADIAACHDTHSAFLDNPYRDLCLHHGKLLKWPIENETEYFNSGVIYVKDNELTQKFFELWSSICIESFKVGINMDQPSFAKANYLSGHIIKPLHDVWNCELKHGIRFLNDAKIVHYLGSKFSDSQLFLLSDKKLLFDIKQNATINNSVLNVVENPFVGISQITHCFGGKDVFLFRSNTYRLLYKLYYSKPNLFSFIEKMSSLLTNCMSKLKH